MKNMFRVVSVFVALVLEGAWAQAYDYPQVTVVGVGGDGLSYVAHALADSEFGFSLEAKSYYSYSNKTFIRFQKDWLSWPSPDWAVDRDTFLVYPVVMGWCELSGIGGDGRTYTEKWPSDGYYSGKVDAFGPREYYEINGVPFVHFSLNGLPWPSRDWGVDARSWLLHCW